jgi:uncharacterized protein (TIGR03083 family)
VDTRLSWPAYLSHLELESRRFVDVLAGTEPGAPVPTCPGWTADDLLHHLAKVQMFWTRVVADRAMTDTDAESIDPAERPDDRDALVALARAATTGLLDALRATEPGEARWSWSQDRTAGFTYRRQAHEALIHRLDAELTAGTRTAFDPALATDGVDEGLRVMLGGCPPWGRITPIEGRTVRLSARDTDASWLVTLSRFTGTDPDGTSHDEPDITTAPRDDGSETLATIAGTAEDLDCWIWNRPTVGEVVQSGNAEVLSEIAALVAQPIT